MNVPSDKEGINKEIAQLERSLEVARAKLKAGAIRPPSDPLNEAVLTSTPHALLLLSDSALPLGSFAFSSGLESYLAHHKSLPHGTSAIASFYHFLHLSIASLGGTTVPYICAAYRDPKHLETLDNDLDASTPCTVARRASVAQGRALLSVWERALRSPGTKSSDPAAVEALSTMSAALKATSSSQPTDLGPNGHFAPLWAVVCRAMAVGLEQTVYVFLYNHAKAVLSAAVRASVMGPYQSHAVLASAWLQEEIQEAVRRNWGVQVEEAGQVVPVLDLWVGRHELLYSRIFNS